MQDVRICFTVQGLGRDEHGNPLPAGVCLTIGKTDKDIDYDSMVKSLDKTELLKFAMLYPLHTADDVTFITPEEYDAEYGVDDDEAEELTERDILPEYDT